MYNFITDPDDWSETFSHQFITAWIDHREAILWQFVWLERHSHFPQVKLTNRDFFSEMSSFMPRKGRAQNVDKRNSPARAGSEKNGNQLIWLNIKLEDNDLDALEQSDNTFEYLSACAIGLASDGFGISLKPIDQGESYCFTIIGSDSDGSGVSYGLSSFAGNVRDVLLVGLYKFDEKLGGTFTDAHKFTIPAKQASRFR